MKILIIFVPFFLAGCAWMANYKDYTAEPHPDFQGAWQSMKYKSQHYYIREDGTGVFCGNVFGKVRPKPIKMFENQIITSFDMRLKVYKSISGIRICVPDILFEDCNTYRKIEIKNLPKGCITT